MAYFSPIKWDDLIDLIKDKPYFPTFPEDGVVMPPPIPVHPETPHDMNTTEKHWFMRRCAISAGFFFGASTGTRSAMSRRIEQHEAKIGRPLQTFNELKEALNILNSLAWDSFMTELSKNNLVIRDWKIHWSAAQRPDVGGQPKPFSPAEKDDAALRRDNASLKETIEKMLVEAAKVDAKIAELTKAAERSGGPVTIRIEKEGAKKPITIDLAHFKLPDLILRMKAGVNVYLVGPAGSGKTTAAEMAALAMSTSFAFMSVGPQTTKTDILGYMNAAGHYVTTVFRTAYEKGGIFLFDELDAGNPGVLTCINAALAGNAASFPDGMVKRHRDFRCIAAGNTFGTGADRQYVGRQEMDAASIDRFNFLEWPYDEGLEKAIAEKDWDHEDGKKWLAHVQAARAAVTKLSLRHVVSPRATFYGISLLKAGAKWADVESTQLWKSLKPGEIDRVRSAMTTTSPITDLKGCKVHTVTSEDVHWQRTPKDVFGFEKLPDPK